MKYRFRFSLPIIAAMGLFYMAPMPALCQQAPAPDAQKAAKDAKSSAPTPRLADGHPDLSGFWVGGGRGAAAASNASPKSTIIQHGDHVEIRVGDHDAPVHLNAAHNDRSQEYFTQRADPNPPPYKPELLAKIKDLAANQNKTDPAFVCKPAGVPRIGPPNAIIQPSGMPIVFLYQLSSGNTYRLIPVDGRPHDADADPSYFGDPVGHWEGDTLVVDTVNFNDDTWLGEAGWIHSDALHVVERITRDGDTIRYQATVEDPKVFTRPWLMNPRMLKPTKDYETENVCVDKDQPTIKDEANIVDQP